jgi:hypothetical protein
MARNLTALALFFGFAADAGAQDMPLSQILIDGEVWQKVAKPGTKPPQLFPGLIAGTQGPSGERPTCYLNAGGTLYVGYSTGRALTAFTLGADRVPKNPAPYAPLRARRGTKGVGVRWLELDRDGRIYAATELGIQVFDPTGRLCGVITTPGEAFVMEFHSDTLIIWLGDNTEYTRKLNTAGVK